MRDRAGSHTSAVRSLAAERQAPLAGFAITIAFTVAFWLAIAHFAAMALGYTLAATTLLNIALGVSVVLGAAIAPFFLATDRR